MLLLVDFLLLQVDRYTILVLSPLDGRHRMARIPPAYSLITMKLNQFFSHYLRKALRPYFRNRVCRGNVRFKGFPSPKKKEFQENGIYGNPC